MTQAILHTPGSGTWRVPPGVTQATFILIGAGGDGAAYANSPVGTSGGGGQCTIAEDVPVTEGSDLTFHVGLHGIAAASGGNPSSPASCDSYVGDPAVTFLFAQGGGSGGFAGVAFGGDYVPVGSTLIYHKGGDSPAGADLTGVPGAGGAGGPNGRGGDGAGVGLFPGVSGGGGGGAANGGGNGVGTNTQAGGDGGANRFGAGAGHGSTAPSDMPTDGVNGGGGGGTWPGPPYKAGSGSQETLWGAYGPGGGAGGVGYKGDLPTFGDGGDGGGRGGGGGGCFIGATPGVGTDGLIVIIYRGTGSADGRGRLNKRYVKTQKKAQQPVQMAKPINTLAPSINQAIVGQVTTGTSGSYTGSPPITLTHQYKLNGSNVGTDSLTYTPPAGSTGEPLELVETATNAGGSISTISNILTVASGAVTPPVGPVCIVAPSINQAQVGSVTVCSPGTWTGSPPIAFTFDGYVNGVLVTTSSAYTTLITQAGEPINYTVTASNAAGTSAPRSTNTLTIANANTIDIPDVTALNAAIANWPSTGNKRWRLTGTDYGGYFFTNHDFSAAPVTWDGLGTATFEFLWIVTVRGVTFQNIANLYGDNGGTSCAVASNGTDPCDVTLVNVNSNSGTAEGTQLNNGFLLSQLQNSTVHIIGSNDNSQPNIFGRDNAILIRDCIGATNITIRDMTITNNGPDNILCLAGENVHIDHNYFGASYNDGRHPDYVQFASDGADYTRNCTVTNNLMLQLGGMGSQGVFQEDTHNITVTGNAILSGVYTDAFANFRGDGCTYTDNFAQGVGGAGGGIVTGGAATNTTGSGNTGQFVGNLPAEGPYPGYNVTGSTLIANASSSTDFTLIDPYLATHPATRQR